MKAIQKISILTLLAVSASAYANDRYSIQIVNRTTDKVFKHCRVSPSGLDYQNSMVDYLDLVDVSISWGQKYKYSHAQISGSKVYYKDDRAHTCDIGHIDPCDGYSSKNKPLIKPPLEVSPDQVLFRSASDNDNMNIKYELNMRYATAQYSFPNQVNYKGWSAYNVNISSYGSFVQGIVKPAPLLQIECDLYDQSDSYLTTFGFVLRKDAEPQFFPGRDGGKYLHDAKEEPTYGSMLTYDITYNG